MSSGAFVGNVFFQRNGISVGSKSICRAHCTPKRRLRACHLPPRALLVTSPYESSLLLADDIYLQIAIGGVGIILSGVLGTVIVGLLARSRYDTVRMHLHKRPYRTSR